MSESYQIDVELRKSEVIWYNFGHIRWLIIIDLIGLLIFICIAYLSFTHPESATRELLETLSIWIAVALAIGFTQPLVVVLQVLFAKPEILRKMTVLRSYLFSDKGIEIYSLGKQAVKIWDDITNVRNMNGLLLIYTGKKAAYVIPKRCLPDKKMWSLFVRYVIGQIKSR